MYSDKKHEPEEVGNKKKTRKKEFCHQENSALGDNIPHDKIFPQKET